MSAVMDKLHVLNQKYDICIVGERNAGISSFLYYYVYGQYVEDEQLELEELFTKTVWKGSVSSEVTILGGLSTEEYYLSSRQRQIKNSNALIFVYSIKDRDSFAGFEDMCARTLSIREDAPPFIVVGLNADTETEDERQVAFDEGYVLCKKLGGIHFQECSAKEGFGINEAFEPIVDAAINIKNNKRNQKGSEKTKMEHISRFSLGNSSRKTSSTIIPQRIGSQKNGEKAEYSDELQTNKTLSVSTTNALNDKKRRNYSLMEKRKTKHEGCCTIA